MLSSSQRSALRAHKYSGQDKSLVYKFILSPLAAWFVELLPLWVAPNLITLLGLAIPAATYAAGHYYSPTLECGGVPRWLFLANGVGLFMYQTLDNMDGKQARRTGSGTPLGQLFDHGCDALNTFFSGVNFGVTCCCGTRDPLLLSVVLLTPTVPFFVGTWEEYHTGSLILPLINGPSEGLLVAVLLNITTFLFGPVWWSWPCPGLPMITCSEAMAFFSLLLAVATSAMQIVGVPLMYYRNRGIRGPALLYPLLGLAPLVWVLFWGALWLGSCDGLFHVRPRAFIALFAALFVESVVNLILSGMTKTRYSPVRTLALPLPLGWFSATYLRFSMYQNEVLLLVYLNIAVAYVAWYLARVVNECTDALDIHCFRIKQAKS